MIKELPSLFVGFSAVALFGVLLTGSQVDESTPATAGTRAPGYVVPASSPDHDNVNGPKFAINSLPPRLP